MGNLRWGRPNEPTFGQLFVKPFKVYIWPQILIIRQLIDFWTYWCIALNLSRYNGNLLENLLESANCVTQPLWAPIECEMRARVGWPVVKGCTSCWRWVCTYIELSLGHFSTSSFKNSNSSKKPLENLFRCWWCYISILRSETQIEHTDQILGGKNVRTGLGTERSEIKKDIFQNLVRK